MTAKWVVYTLHHAGGIGRFLDVADSKEEAKELGDKWWTAFDSGEKEKPVGYAGISWKPVESFDEWGATSDD